MSVVDNKELEAQEEGHTGGREKWGNHISLVFSLMGYTIGLSNIWRFPYLCMTNGGGAFLIPYFTFLLLCGMPLFFLEMSMGQFSSKGPINVWKCIPLMQGLGWGSMILCLLFSLYYNTIITWVFYYLIRSFTANLPWSSCNNWWNTPLCFQNNVTIAQNGNHSNYTYTVPESDSVIVAENIRLGDLTSGNHVLNSSGLDNNISSVNSTVKWRSPSEEFWTHGVLQLSRGIEYQEGFQWELLGTLILSWVIVYICIAKGVKSLSKALYITVPFPYVCLTILLIRGVTLPGSLEGIKYYVIPEWRQLLNPQIWGNACTQIFYTLGPAWGGVILMSSFAEFNNNCQRDSIFICLVTCLTSFFAGFVVFAILGFMSYDMGVDIKEVVTSGPGLVFITYPEAISRMPLPTLWAIVFFFMLITVGLDSQFTSVETVCRTVLDVLPPRYTKRPALVSLVVCGVMFLIGLIFVTKGGMYNFQIVDWYVGVFSVWVIAILEALSVAYIYGANRMYSDIKLMLGYSPLIWWKVSWMFITPFLLTGMLFWSLFLMTPPKYGSYTYPVWAVIIGWGIAIVGTLPVVVVAIYKVSSTKGSLKERMHYLIRPSADWGPDSVTHRKGTQYELVPPVYEVTAPNIQNGHLTVV